MKVARLSNLLSIAPSAYDPATSEPPREEEYVDEEGKRRVRIRNQNPIRWRARALPDGSTVRESNARCGAESISEIIQCNAAWRRAYLHQVCCKHGLYMAYVRAALRLLCLVEHERYCRAWHLVHTATCAAGGCRFIRWSDGSLQLQIGDEVLDVAEHDVRNDHSFLFIRHSQIIQARWPCKAQGPRVAQQGLKKLQSRTPYVLCLQILPCFMHLQSLRDLVTTWGRRIARGLSVDHAWH